MSQHTTSPTLRDLTGNLSCESMELADVRSRTGLPDSAAAEMDAAFGYGTEGDELSERELDAMWVAEMERRDASNGDDEPDPTPGGIMAAGFQAYSDDDLISAVGLLDAGKVENISEADRLKLLDCGTRELLRRLDDDARRAA